MCRVATENFEIGGVTIKEGDQVVLMYSSANRDPSHFDNPETLDVYRSPNHHLSFGHGTHFCLGASLARLEIKIFFEEFELKTKKKIIDNYITKILCENYVDDDDKGHIEIEVFFGKKIVTIKLFDRTLN